MKNNGRLKSLRVALWANLSERVSPRGFRRRGRLSDLQLEKACDFGKACFCVYPIYHSDDFDVTASVYLRFDEVEEISTRTKKNLNAKQKKGTVTLGGDIGNLTIGERMRWTVRDESDIEPVAEQLEGQFSDMALPYFEKYGDLNAAYKLASSNETGPSQIPANIDGIAMTAVAAAIVLKKGDDEIRQLVDRKRKYFARRRYDTERFDEFIQSLIDGKLLRMEVS